jgi:uncharacterized protein (DUF3084 family)
MAGGSEWHCMAESTRGLSAQGVGQAGEWSGPKRSAPVQCAWTTSRSRCFWPLYLHTADDRIRAVISQLSDGPNQSTLATAVWPAARVAGRVTAY